MKKKSLKNILKKTFNKITKSKSKVKIKTIKKVKVLKKAKVIKKTKPLKNIKSKKNLKVTKPISNKNHEKVETKSDGFRISKVMK